MKNELNKLYDKEFPGPIGGKRANAGRKKGIPNIVTTEFRDTVRRVLEENSENVSIWLKRVAHKNPGKALDVIAKLAEYAAPKLVRAEISGDKNNPLTIQHIQRTIVDTAITLDQKFTEVKPISSKASNLKGNK